jgi:anti-sigma regulatory factor (Ser/Thr protein kinase)
MNSASADTAHRMQGSRGSDEGSRGPEVGGPPLPDAPRGASTFPFRADLRAVRAHTRAWAVDHDLPVDIQEDLVLAVDELAANSLRHAGGHGELRLWDEDRSVLAEVEDDGWIRDPDVGRSLPPMDQIDGRGLWIACSLADQLQIRSGPDGTVIRARFDQR